MYVEFENLNECDIDVNAINGNGEDEQETIKAYITELEHCNLIHFDL